MMLKLVKLKTKLLILIMINILLLQKFNKLIAENFDAILAQARLIRKTDFDNKRISLNTKIDLNKTKQVLPENELKKTFDSVFCRGKTQFLPINRYFKRVACVGSGIYIYFFKSKGFSGEDITPPVTSSYRFTPNLRYFDTKKE